MLGVYLGAVWVLCKSYYVLENADILLLTIIEAL